ncbi:Bromodomain [Arabidopsis suecica]|uniref:Bromodomain n=1 Tax=Arabidopsis suecica TaxID=45249 RepID=A0A8T2BS23_ARASU|nr:Bromodomain [Arabidopsis suecica]
MKEEWFGWGFEELVVDNPDYFSVISKPMDFVTINSKLAKNLYVNIVQEFPEDVRLFFANSVRYYPPENPLHKNAEDVRLFFTNAVRYYPPENPLHKNAKKLKEIFEFRWESVKKKLACEVSKTPESKSDQGSKGFALTMPLSHKKALRAATIRIRYSDTIIKAKYRKLIDESSNKADVLMRMQKEKQLLERRERGVKARIEAETRAARLKVVCEERLAREKLEEEAKSNFEDHFETEKVVKLCGGSYLARTRCLKDLGLVLRIDYWPELEEIKEEGEI